MQTRGAPVPTMGPELILLLVGPGLVAAFSSLLKEKQEDVYKHYR